MIRPEFRFDRSTVQRALLAGLLMAGLAILGIEFTRSSGRIAAVWFANGAVLAVLLRSARPQWPTILGAAFAANVVANLAVGDPVAQALVLSACNSLEILLVALALRRFSTGADFTRSNAIFVFAGAAIVASAAAGLIAATYLSFGPGWSALFRTWFFADTLGLLLVTPLAITWSQKWVMPNRWPRVAEQALITVIALAATFFVFSAPTPRLFLIMPVLLLAGFRLQPIATATVTFLCAIIATAMTFTGSGPIAASSASLTDQVMLLQAFVATGFILSLPVSGVISERRDLEVRLLERERQFRLLAESSPGGILLYDLDGRPIYMNTRWGELTGVGLDTVRDHGWDCVLDDSARAAARAAWDSALAHGAERRLTVPAAGEAAGWFELFVLPERDGEGQLTGWIVKLIDATDRVAQARKLADREAQYRLFADNMRDMIVSMALDGTPTFVSAAARDLVGYAPEELVARPPASSVYPDDRPMVLDAIRRIAAGGADQVLRYRKIRKDGSIQWVETAFRLARSQDDSPPQIIATVRDIQARHEAEQLAAQALDEARAAAEAKSNFLATMSHEIRTPMTGVLGMIDLLHDDLDPAERATYLATLKGSAGLLMSILNDVLDFSRLEHGPPALDVQAFDLPALLRRTLDLFANSASRKGVLLGLTIAKDVPSTVRGDPMRLQQVLSNLVNNAIKFTDSGTIDVVVTSAASGRVRVQVLDCGIGIDAATLDGLFEPFAQADVGNERRYGGTGLGLAICKRLVEAMDGTIHAASVPGVGSTFTFELPLERVEAPAAVLGETPLPDGASAAPTRALRLLVAEDNKVNQMLIAALLRRLGHDCTIVANGREAVEALAAEPFDGVLMDMQMPEMDGLTATRAIRRTDPLTPIIALTADASAERRRFYDNAGLTDFLTKPIELDRLGAVLGAIAAAPADGQAPGAAAPAPDDGFDHAYLGRIRDALGPDRADALLGMFRDELVERPASIAAAVAEGRTDQARAQAHSLKGAAGSVGAVAVAEAARVIEEWPADGAPAALSDALDALCRAADAARAALNVGRGRPIADPALHVG